MTASNADSRNIIELNLGVSVCTLRVPGYAHILASSEFGLDFGLPRGASLRHSRDGVFIRGPLMRTGRKKKNSCRI